MKFPGVLLCAHPAGGAEDAHEAGRARVRGLKS